MCAEFGLGIVPWGILAEGFLTGKHTRDQFNQDSKRQSALSHGKKEQNWEILDVVNTIAQECKRSPAQVTINWMLQKPGITSPLIGARTQAQLEDNIGALEFTLSESQMARLDKVSNPDEWPFPNEICRSLRGFVDGGLKIQRPSEFHPVNNLKTQADI
jgi:aryl-alcohol dehydrogenase-like predicted oxidoreductase